MLADSGTDFMMGAAISRCGLMDAKLPATPASDMNAPVAMPYARLNAMYSDVDTPVCTAVK